MLVLLSMVFVAGFSAGIRNLTRFDIQWANQLLTDMEWADSFQRKATMFLAFLGASQAAHYRKHIAIDVLTRIAPLKARWTMHAAAGIIAALITFALAFSLSEAVKLNLTERPIEYEMLGENGSKHICEGTEAELKNLEGLEIPTVFCGIRSVLGSIGLKPETPGAAFQLVVPFMFIVIGLRFLGAGISATLGVVGGVEALTRLDEEEHARLAAVHAAVSGDPDHKDPYEPDDAGQPDVHAGYPGDPHAADHEHAAYDESHLHEADEYASHESYGHEGEIPEGDLAEGDIEDDEELSDEERKDREGRS
ncbi:MAG: TRAP transporter small permease subunit [Polyangiales bacterium]